MTKAEATRLVAILAAAWPDSKATQQTMALYVTRLLECDYGAAEAAVRRLVDNSRWLPRIADLLDAIEPPPAIALEQWGRVCYAIRMEGTYSPQPKFRDAVTEHCVGLMGWRYLCKSSNDVADRARFCELYDAVANRDRIERRAGQIRTIAAASTRQLEQGNG